MRYLTGSFILAVLLSVIGCGGPTAPSSVLTVSPEASKALGVGDTQIFTIEGAAHHPSYYFSPAVTAFCTVTLDEHSNTITIKVTKKPTAKTSTLTVTSWTEGYKSEQSDTAVVNFK